MLDEVLSAVCAEIGIQDVQACIDARMLSVEGFECSFEMPEGAPETLYLMFNFGIATAGRTLRLFKAMLEANITAYAQDQAQLGIDSDTGVILLIVRVDGANAGDAAWLCDILAHYAEHGRYWRDNIFRADDEMFEGIASGDYIWIRA
jgi:type III secretion control protein HpaB